MDFSNKTSTIKTIIEEAKKLLFNNYQIAYVLATVEWETAGTFKPVREAFWKDNPDVKTGDKWRQKNFRYFPYYGRGFVQLTWKFNYEHYANRLKIDLVNNPDLALDAGNALFILLDGFKYGIFTKVKITDYINDNKQDFFNARRCINGVDHAVDIALKAEYYLKELQDGKI